MAINTIDAKTLQKMFIAGAKNLEAKKEWINDLNVFPVPDGDTGTNMTMTIMSAVKEVAAVEKPALATLAKAISSGSLRGARGNSGVILSQLFRGFCKEISGMDVIDAQGLARAAQKGVETAYKAVMKPKEGTILTVAKGMAEKAQEVALETDDMEEMVRLVIEEGDRILLKTPEMLPVLKEAGVVDSGGQGLMEVLHGCYNALTGKETDFSVDVEAAAPAPAKKEFQGSAMENVDIKFGYCTEFIVMLETDFSDKDEAEFKAYLESIGDSLVCVADDELVKIHVHTNDPGLAIQKGLSYGSLTRMKIDNMREEHNERIFQKQETQKAEEKETKQSAKEEPVKEIETASAPEEQTAKTAQAEELPEETLNITEVSLDEETKTDAKAFGFVAISAGRGLAEIFEGLGADEVIQGGQTMNPSTEDIMQAVERINAQVVFVLPNNKNIILAAQQTASLVEDKKVIVIPTTTIPQGITALINFEMGKTAQENEQDMLESLKTVQSGQLTYAVRDTSIDGMEIKCGDIMGIGDKGIMAVGQDVKETLMEMLEKMVTEESGLISVYYGNNISPQEAQKLREMIEKKYSDLDVEIQSGGQPVYYYILSVE